MKRNGSAGATSEPDVQEMSLDELIMRVTAAAEKMARTNSNRVLLFNAAMVLSSLGQQLEAAWAANAALRSRGRIVLPAGADPNVN